MKKNVFKLMALFAVVLCGVAFTACGTDEDEEGGSGSGSTPNASKYVSVEITRCERVGSVLQLDFNVTNKNNSDITVSLRYPEITDNNGTTYGYGSSYVSTGSNNYGTGTNITITGKNTIQGHAKITDFDPLNTAKTIKFSMNVGVTNINCDATDFVNSKVQITDNRVMAHGVQTNDTNLDWKVTSCKRDADGDLVLGFTMKNNTGIALENVIIRYSSAFDNLGNKFGYGSMYVRWGSSTSYSTNSLVNIAAGDEIEGGIALKDFDAKATEVTANMSIEVGNYITSDNTVRFLTIPVTK